MRVGLLGGTFNPIHNMHIDIALTAKSKLDLDEVWFIPTNIPPHKKANDLASNEDRLNMINIAISEYEGLKALDIEFKRDNVSYTIDTIRELKSLHPNYDFYYIIGADNVEILEKWRSIDELVRLVKFVAFKRPNHTIKSKYDLIVIDHIERNISSTNIRSGNCEDVPKSIYKYIKEHSLYNCMTIDDALAILKDNVKGYRYEHTISTYKTAIEIAKKHKIDTYKVSIACILHDLIKGIMTFEQQKEYILNKMDEKILELHPNIWHGPIAAHYIKEIYNIYDDEIYEAIYYHVTGKPNMSDVSKCLFVADYSEPTRKHETSKIVYEEAFKNLDKAVYLSLKYTHDYLISIGGYPDKLHQEALKYYEEMI